MPTPWRMLKPTHARHISGSFVMANVDSLIKLISPSLYGISLSGLYVYATVQIECNRPGTLYMHNAFLQRPKRAGVTFSPFAKWHDSMVWSVWRYLSGDIARPPFS